MATAAPSRASASEISRPTSRPPPVTNATLPFSPRSMSAFPFAAREARVLAQPAAQHLARERFRQLRDELDHVGGLVRREHSPGVRLDLLLERGGCSEAVFQRHEGVDLLAD